MKRAVIAIAVVALVIGGGAWWLHRARKASMAEFETGYEAAAGDAGAP